MEFLKVLMGGHNELEDSFELSCLLRNTTNLSWSDAQFVAFLSDKMQKESPNSQLYLMGSAYNGTGNYSDVDLVAINERFTEFPTLIDMVEKSFFHCIRQGYSTDFSL